MSLNPGGLLLAGMGLVFEFFGSLQLVMTKKRRGNAKLLEAVVVENEPQEGSLVTPVLEATLPSGEVVRAKSTRTMTRNIAPDVETKTSAYYLAEQNEFLEGGFVTMLVPVVFIVVGGVVLFGGIAFAVLGAP